MKPIDPIAQHEYVDEDDAKLPPAEQTRWYFRPLSVRERAFIENSAVGVTVDLREVAEGTAIEKDLQQRDGDVRLLRVKLSLARVENYDAAWETEPNPIDRNRPPVPTDAFLSTIPPLAFQRMSRFAMTLGRVSVAEGKPSAPSSTGSSTDPSPPSAASSALPEPSPAAPTA